MVIIFTIILFILVLYVLLYCYIFTIMSFTSILCYQRVEPEGRLYVYII